LKGKREKKKRGRERKSDGTYSLVIWGKKGEKGKIPGQGIHPTSRSCSPLAERGGKKRKKRGKKGESGPVTLLKGSAKEKKKEEKKREKKQQESRKEIDFSFDDVWPA